MCANKATQSIDGKKDAAPLPACAGMHDAYGPLARWGFRQIFGQAVYPAEAQDHIREHHASGTLVYVARGRTSALPLYFNQALARAGLPLAQIVVGASLALWQPLSRLWEMWRTRGPRNNPHQQLEQRLKLGHTAFMALRPGSRNNASRSGQTLMRAAIRAQNANPNRPLWLIPHALVDHYQSGAMGGSLTDRILGTRRQLTTIRQLPTFFSIFRSGKIRVGDAVDVRAFVQAHPELDESDQAAKLALTVHAAIDDEERVIAGPALPDFDVATQRILEQAPLQQAIEQQAAKSGKSPHQLKARARQHVAAIAARYNYRYVQLVGRILHWVFHRIYNGITLDTTGLDEALAAARRSPVVFCPSHKSHIDYLVLSYVLWYHGITPPHIAAGANLSFFPLGYFFRRCGAFFLKRSFRDDLLYANVFQGYINELVHEGAAIEFFIEGTRSRTGKPLMPRFGILNMLYRAWAQGIRDDIIFVPVSIDYERVVEARSYRRELSGANKKAEDLGGLLKSTQVLRSRYGRVAIQFGTPISLSELSQRLDTNEDKKVVEYLGYQILHQIATCCSVTATAVVSTALLGYPSRGLSEARLLLLCESIIDYIRAQQGRITPTIENAETRSHALLEAARRLRDEGLVRIDVAGGTCPEPVYRAEENERISLDFHKNAIINLFIPVALVARAIERAEGKDTPSITQLKDDVVYLSRLFKREFVYPPGRDFVTTFDQNLTFLATNDIIRLANDRVEVTQRDPLELLSGLLDSFLEAYLMMAENLRDLLSFPLRREELQKRALERCTKAVLEGAIHRPEAANKTLLDSAAQWFESEGIIITEKAARQADARLNPDITEDELNRYINDIRRFVRRPSWWV